MFVYFPYADIRVFLYMSVYPKHQGQVLHKWWSLGVYTVQYVESILTFKRMCYLDLQGDWIWCKRMPRWLQGGNTSITQEGLKNLGQTYIMCQLSKDTVYLQTPDMGGILPQKLIGIQLYVNFPCYFGQHSTLNSNHGIPFQVSSHTRQISYLCVTSMVVP